MKTIYNILKRGSAGFMSCIALDGYRRAVINDSKVKESDRLLQYTINKYESALKLVEEKQDKICVDNTEVVASLGRIKQGADLVNKDTDNLVNQVSINNNTGIDTSSKVLSKSTNRVIDDINKLLDKLNTGSGDKGHYLESNCLTLKDFFSSYSTVELGAISHILACVFVFGCLLGIIVAYYGVNKKLFIRKEATRKKKRMHKNCLSHNKVYSLGYGSEKDVMRLHREDYLNHARKTRKK